MTTTSKGITYGTFDTLHFGHLRLIKRILEQVDHLTIGLSTDEFNTLKGKKAIQSYEERKGYLEMIENVDVIPEYSWEQKKEETKDKKFFMGDDWKGKFDDFNCIYLERTPNISSTKIRNIIK